MKNLKLPVINEEDRKTAWVNLKVDDKLVYIENSYWNDSYDINYFTVVKRTPKGSIRLNNGELLKFFDSHYYIITVELLEWIRKITLERDIMNLLYEVDRDKKNFKNNLDYDDAIKLKEILEKTIQNNQIEE